MYALLIFLICVGCASSEKEIAAELKDVDGQIESTMQELKKDELETMQLELDSQGKMFEQWHQYAEETEEVEKKEVRVRELDRKLHDLEQRRKKLMEQLHKAP